MRRAELRRSAGHGLEDNPDPVFLARDVLPRLSTPSVKKMKMVISVLIVSQCEPISQDLILTATFESNNLT